MIAFSCSLCSLIPQHLSQRSWVLNTCYYCIRLANFVLGLPVLRIVGAVIGLILLVNIRSLPLVWHLRVMLPLGILRFRYRMLSLYHAVTLQPSLTRHRAVIDQLESLCPVGTNPFEFSATVSAWASEYWSARATKDILWFQVLILNHDTQGPDETDWLGHVSNSNYAKTRDVAFSKFIAALPTFVNAGGWVALSSTHYRFLREIPRFARYEVNLSIGAWDDKWLYLVCRFTTPLRDASSNTKLGDPATGRSTTTGQSESSHSGNTSDSDGASTPRFSYVEFPLASGKAAFQTLNCLAVSRVCFKLGRITVPPAIVLSCEGFSKPPIVGSYSQRLPPPHWVHPHVLRNTSESLDAYKHFLKGGWRDVPEGDEWWIEALSGPIEERRRANLANFQTMDRAMVGCMDFL